MYVGSDDGVYRVPREGGEPRRVLDAGRVMRLRQFEGVDGTVAATRTGLYRQTGDGWRDLGVPREQVYSVGAAPRGPLFVGTRPAAVYGASPAEPEWYELDGVQALPSRDDWRLPRHEDLAQVRDVHVDADSDGSRLVAGVEVGGVHVSEDGGATWVERRDGVDDDVHELHVAGPGEYVAATGSGLYRSTDAGRSWTRLDGDIEQRYFRSVHTHDGTVYAGGALANSSTWNDSDADPQFVAVRDGDLERVAIPYPDETVTGIATVDGDLVVATHRGHVLRRDGTDWEELATVPTPGDVTGRYTPVVGE